MDWQAIVRLLQDSMQDIADIVMWVVLQAPWIILLYLFVILLFVWFLRSLKKNYYRVLGQFVRRFDEIMYRYTQQIVLHKDELHDVDNTMILLFSNKQKIFEWEEPRYLDHVETLQQDVMYVENLLMTNLVDEEIWQILSNEKDSVLQSSKMYVSVKAVLALCTLGISWFFTESLRY